MSKKKRNPRATMAQVCLTRYFKAQGLAYECTHGVLSIKALIGLLKLCRPEAYEQASKHRDKAEIIVAAADILGAMKHRKKTVPFVVPSIKDWKPKPQAPAQDVSSSEFLQTYEWRRVRMQALKKYGPRCMCCGATPADGATMNVDHIKPRKLFPELALDLDNLQILCGECNHGKGNWDMTDWRTRSAA